MLFYVLSALAACVLWKIVGFVHSWRQKCLAVRGITTVPNLHFIWGVLNQVSNGQDFIRINQKTVEDFRPRLFVSWILHHVHVFACHPSTLKQVLQAPNIPKHTGRLGGYRMLKPWLGDGLLISWGKKWERNRRLLTPAFHFDILKPYIDVYHRVTDTFLDKINALTSDGQSVDIFPLVSRATFDTMLRCTLSYNDDTMQDVGSGLQHPYVEAVHRLSYLVMKRIVDASGHYDTLYSLTSNGREFKKLCNYVHDLSWKIIKSRKAALEADPSQVDKRHLDFLDILLTARDGTGAGLTDHEIRDEVDTFMFEGHDTTASAISWTLYALAKYPDMQDRVRREVKDLLDGNKELKYDDLSKLPYTTCFIKECLRMYSPVPNTTRLLAEPFEIDGKILPAGIPIEITPYLIHHHPDVWDNHMEFRPERFTPENSEGRDPFAFIPFSAGYRNCIGQNFAMNEIKVMISRVVSRCRLRTDPKREAEMWADIIMRSKDGIYLHVEELL